MVRGLLVGIGVLYQRGLVERAAQELQAGRQLVVGKAHGHGEGRLPGVRGNQLAVIALITLEIADFGGRVVPGGVHQRAHFVLVHHGRNRGPECDAARVGVRLAAAGFVGLRAHAVGQLVLQVFLDVGRILARSQHLVDVVHRRARAQRGQVLVDVVLEHGAPLAGTHAGKIRDFHVHDRGPGPAQIRDGPLEQGFYLGVGVAFAQRAQHPDAGPLQALGVEKSRVALGRPPARAVARERVGGVGAGGHGVEQPGGVGHGAGHGAAGVVAQVKRRNAGPAQQPERGPKSDQGVVRRRPADGVAGVGAQARGAKAGRHGCRRAAARARRHVRQVVRVAGFARNRADADHGAEGPLGHVGLGKHDGPGGFQGLHHRGVGVRRKTLERPRARGGLQAGRVVIVFHNQGRAVQRPQLARAAVLGVELPGGFQRGGVRDHDGVEPGGLVVGGDAGLVRPHQLLAVAVAAPEGLLHVGNRGFRHVEGSAGSVVLPLRRGVAAAAGHREGCDQQAKEPETGVLKHGRAQIGKPEQKI